MRSCSAILVLLFFSVPALGDSNEDHLRDLIKRLPPMEQENLAKATYGGNHSLWRLVTYTTHDGRLLATFHLPADLVKKFHDPEPVFISIEGSPHLWTLRRAKSGTLDDGLSRITLTCYAPDDTGPFNLFAIASDGDRMMVSASQMFGHPSLQQVLTITQDDRTLHLTWRLRAQKLERKRLDVTDLAQIPTRQPELLERYIMPVLRRLGPGLPRSDVYRVFDQIPADPKVTEKVMPFVNRLDSDDAAVRESAAASLKSMGPPALLACLRLDRTLLSPEQKNRIEAFCASDGWTHVIDLEAARLDPEFLSACLEDEDPAVRSVASNLLAALRTAKPRLP